MLAVIGIVYGAMVALVQKDFKFVIGYSSVSHMGFVLLGLMTLTTIGLSGAVLQMFSHGVIAGLLFGVVGRMVYERTHTRELEELQPMRLSQALPFAAVTFVVAGLASMGMPGFSGFVAEFQVLIGAWKAFPTFAVLAGLGVLLGVAYTLRAIQKAFFGEPDGSDPVALASGEMAVLGGAGAAVATLPGPTVGLAETSAAGAGAGGKRGQASGSGHGLASKAHGLDAITVPERIGAALLLAATLLIGLFPQLLLRWIGPAIQSPLLENVLKGGGR
jgi:NADH-quinone oxidoreductase subunit M